MKNPFPLKDFTRDTILALDKDNALLWWLAAQGLYGEPTPGLDTNATCIHDLGLIATAETTAHTLTIEITGYGRQKLGSPNALAKWSNETAETVSLNHWAQGGGLWVVRDVDGVIVAKNECWLTAMLQFLALMPVSGVPK